MGVFSFVGDLFNDLLGGNSARRDSQSYNLQNMAVQQQYGEKNMAIQNKYNVEAFNAENAYNSPLAQRQRMEQAGLNPNWDGPGSVVAQQDSGVSASAPSGGMPSGSNDGSALGFLAQMLTLNQDLKVKKSEEKKNEAETQNILGMLPYNQENVRANTKAALAKAGVDEKTAEYYLSDLEHKWENLGFQNLSLQEAIKRIEELLPHEKEKMSAETYNVLMSGALNKVLAECKPKEVAIAQQEANISQQEANTHSAAQREDVRHNIVSEGIDSYNAISKRQEVQETIRNNKTVNTINSLIARSQASLNSKLGSLYDAQSKKVDVERFSLEMYNEFYKEVRDSDLDYALKNALLWKIKAETEQIEKMTFKTEKELEYYMDTWYGRLLKDHLPIPFLK